MKYNFKILVKNFEKKKHYDLSQKMGIFQKMRKIAKSFSPSQKTENFSDLETKIKSIQDIRKEVGDDEKHKFFRF